MTVISSVQLPPVSQEFIKALEAAFPPFDIEPGFCRDAAMQSAGERKVIEWIKIKAGRATTVTGDARALRQTTPTGAVVKLGE